MNQYMNYCLNGKPLNVYYLSHVRGMATEMIKALYEFCPIDIRDHFKEENIIYNLHSTLFLKQSMCNTVIYALISFQYKGANGV